MESGLCSHAEQQKVWNSQLRTLGGSGEGDATKTFHTPFYSKPFHLHQSINVRVLNLPRNPHLATALSFRT